jgi:hypothetical protein
MRLHCLSTLSLRLSPSGAKLTTLARIPAYYAYVAPRRSLPHGYPPTPVPVYVTRPRCLLR